MPTVGESSRRAALSGWPLGGSPHFSGAAALSAFGADAEAGADALALGPAGCVAGPAAEADGAAAEAAVGELRAGMTTIPGDVPLMTPCRLSYSEPLACAQTEMCAANVAAATRMTKAVFMNRCE